MVTVLMDPSVVFEKLVEEDEFALERALGCVGDLMTRDVVTLGPEDTLPAAIDLFASRKFRHLPITDGTRVVGILSDRDAMRALLRGRDAGAVKIAAAMTAEPVTIRPYAVLSEAIHLLLSHRINCLPVTTEDGALQGILTSTDLLQALFALQRWLESRANRLDS
jgi:acetoin utilization protein AcuB